jgi:arsenate reductase-like glutaredoxin family protein
MPQKTYAHLKNLEPEIVKMREEGLSKREIAEYFSLTKEQVKEMIGKIREMPFTTSIFGGKENVPEGFIIEQI